MAVPGRTLGHTIIFKIWGIRAMKLLSTALALGALFAANATWAGCTYPKAPEKIPDGSTASKDEMLAGQKTVRAYEDQIKTYTECLKADHDDQVGKIDPKLDPAKQATIKADMDKVLQQKNDAAVDEAQALADRFNAQIHAFNAKKKS